MSHLIVVAKPFSESQVAEIDTILRAKFNGSLTTRTTHRHINQWIARNVDITQDKVNSWIKNLETKFKLVLPTNTIKLIQSKKGV